MARTFWQGKAANTADKKSFTVTGTFAAGEKITLQAGAASSTIVITLGSENLTAAGISELILLAWIGGKPKGDEVTTGTPSGMFASLVPIWEDGEGVLLIEGLAGIPCDFSITTDSSSGVITTAVITVATGKHFADNAQNYSATPANDDTIVFQDGSIDCLYNLDTFTGIVVEQHASFTGQIGLQPTIVGSGFGNYPEYRNRFFVCEGGATLGLGEGPNSSGGIFLSAGADEGADFHVVSTGPHTGTGAPVQIVNLTGTCEIRIESGDVAIETSSEFNPNSEPNIYVADGVLELGKFTTPELLHVVGNAEVTLNGDVKKLIVNSEIGRVIVHGNINNTGSDSRVSGCHLEMNGGTIGGTSFNMYHPSTLDLSRNTNQSLSLAADVTTNGDVGIEDPRGLILGSAHGIHAIGRSRHGLGNINLGSQNFIIDLTEG